MRDRGAAGGPPARPGARGRTPPPAPGRQAVPERERGTPLFRTGRLQNYSLSVSGGSEAARYYLATDYDRNLAAMIAAGLHGIDEELELEDAMGGNAYESDNERVPATLAAAAELFSGSKLARAAFGDDVVEHYRNMADVELAAFGRAVTGWERYRGLERL